MEKQKIEKEGNTSYLHINVLIHYTLGNPMRQLQILLQFKLSIMV